MPRRIDPSYQRPQAWGLLPGTVLWLALGLSMMAVLWAGMLIALNGVQIDQSVRLDVHWHHPPASTATVELSDGIPFGRIEVKEGDKVVAGQTVMTLDTDLLQDRLDMIERQILTARVERRCYLDNGATQGQQINDQRVDQATRDLLDAGLMRCFSHFQERTSQVAAHEAALAALDGQVSQLDRQLALTFQSDDSTQTRAEVAVSITLNRHRVDTLRAFETGRLAQTRAASAQRQNAVIADLSTRIEAQISLRNRINGALASPELAAPQSGVVTRVRDFGKGNFSKGAVTYAVITPEDDAAPVLRAAIPDDIVDEIDVGTNLLAGFPNNAPNEPAQLLQVSALSPAAQPGTALVASLIGDFDSNLDPSQLWVEFPRPASRIIHDLQKRFRGASFFFFPDIQAHQDL